MSLAAASFCPAAWLGSSARSLALVPLFFFIIIASTTASYCVAFTRLCLDVASICVTDAFDILLLGYLLILKLWSLASGFRELISCLGLSRFDLASKQQSFTSLLFLLVSCFGVPCQARSSFLL